METELGRITIPQFATGALSLARTLTAESSDPRVKQICKALLDLESKLAKLSPEIQKVFQELQKNLDERRRK